MAGPSSPVGYEADAAGHESEAGPGDDGSPPVAVVAQVGDAVFAVPVAQVARVVRAAPPVRLPGAPPEVLGVVNVKGTMVVVVDPSPALGQARRPPAEAAAGRLLVVEGRHGPVGLRVDLVRDVAPVADVVDEGLPVVDAAALSATVGGAVAERVEAPADRPATPEANRTGADGTS